MLISICLWINCAYADDGNYKVLYVNDTNLKYTDGKPVKNGDVIRDIDAIKWDKEKQAVKVINLSTKRIILFTKKAWKRQKGISTLGEDRLFSTQTSGDSTIFASQYDLMDSIEIPIEIPTEIELSDSCYFTVSYMYGDTKISKTLVHRDHHVIIDMTLFQSEGKILEPRDIKLSIEYVNQDKGTKYIRNVDIFVFPKVIN